MQGSADVQCELKYHTKYNNFSVLLLPW